MTELSDLSIQDDDPLVIESVTWLDGSPAQRESTLQAARWFAQARARLTTAGVIALAGGLVSLWAFLLPWFVAPLTLLQGGPDPRGFSPSDTTRLPGWSVATGMPAGGGPNGTLHLALFVHLWLVPLAAISLLIVAWYAAQRRLPERLAAGTILALAVLATLVELGYVVQVGSLAHAMSAGISVAWGCWLALAVSLITGTAASNLLRPGESLIDE